MLFGVVLWWGWWVCFWLLVCLTWVFGCVSVWLAVFACCLYVEVVWFGLLCACYLLAVFVVFGCDWCDLVLVYCDGLRLIVVVYGWVWF